MATVGTSPLAEALPEAYAAWRWRMLVGSLLANVIGVALHGPTGEITLRLDVDEWPSVWFLVGFFAVLIGALGPGLLGSCYALAAIWSWRRLGRSGWYARAAWALWVLGPLPILLLPLPYLFHLNAVDSLKTSAAQVRHLLTVTVPALFALLPGAVRGALVLERFLPESRAPGQVALVAAPACAAAYLVPLGIVAQLAFHTGLYLGLLLLAVSPLVPLIAVPWLLRRDTPERARRIVWVIGALQGALGAAGVVLLLLFVADHPLLQTWLGKIDPVWAAGLVIKVLAGKWLMTVVVSDLLISMLHQGQQAAHSLTGTAEGEALGRKLDALGAALRTHHPSERRTAS